MVSGIFAGDSKKLSVASSLPLLKQLEREHGGLVRGMVARMRAARRAHPGGPKVRASAGPGGTLTSFREGMETLPRALAAGVSRLELATPVKTLEARPGGGFRIVTLTGETIESPVVVVATPPRGGGGAPRRARPRARGRARRDRRGTDRGRRHRLSHRRSAGTARRLWLPRAPRRGAPHARLALGLLDLSRPRAGGPASSSAPWSAAPTIGRRWPSSPTPSLPSHPRAGDRARARSRARVRARDPSRARDLAVRARPRGTLQRMERPPGRASGAPPRRLRLPGSGGEPRPRRRDRARQRLAAAVSATAAGAGAQRTITSFR